MPKKKYYNCGKHSNFSARCFSRKPYISLKQANAAGVLVPIRVIAGKNLSTHLIPIPSLIKISEKLDIWTVNGHERLQTFCYCCTDTGAHVDIILVSDFKKIHEQNLEIKRHIKKAKKKIYALNGEELEVITTIKDVKISNINGEIFSDPYVIQDGIRKYSLLSE